MGIFSRLTDIVNSNLNSILASAEDPEKIVRLVIQEMEDTLVEVRSQAVGAIAERKELQRRIETMVREEDDWQRKAELALTRDREDLAKGALQARANVARAREAASVQLAQLVAGLDAQSADIAKLQAKLADARAREKALASRQKVASSRLRLRATLHDQRVTDAFTRFEQVERALDQAEGRVEAYDLGRAPGKPSLAEELAGLETDAAVEDELRALKQRLSDRRSPGEGAS
jgi:phage shock protein A